MDISNHFQSDCHRRFSNGESGPAIRQRNTIRSLFFCTDKTREVPISFKSVGTANGFTPRDEPYVNPNVEIANHVVHRQIERESRGERSLLRGDKTHSRLASRIEMCRPIVNRFCNGRNDVLDLAFDRKLRTGR